MQKHFYAVLLFSFLSSCIPFQIAPTIDDYKLVKGKRFKKGLPSKTTFVFQDPKAYGDFYKFINAKYQLNDYFVDVEVPFEIEGETFYLSFYEVMKKSKALFLVPLATDIAINEATNSGEFEPVFAKQDNTILEGGTFYVVIEVYSDDEKDCLSQSSRNRQRALAYLQNLKAEYLNTHNYNELLFKN